MKSARERVQIVSAYNELGSYRAAAKLCGTTHKTVRRIVERQRAGGLAPPRKKRPKNTDAVADLVAERVRATRRTPRSKRTPRPRPRGKSWRSGKSGSIDPLQRRSADP